MTSPLAIPPASPSLLPKLRAFAADIKLSHTVFAMPFALLSATLAAHRAGGVKAGQLLLIVACMVTARTVAMGANRYFDAAGDALNPRTAGRAIPAGRLGKPFVLAMIGLSVGGFVLAALGFWWLYANPWPAILAVPVLVYLSAYPLFKRFTALCHFYLGSALALAPVCAWVAIAGNLAPPPLWMAAGVLLWTAGFDVIYACQDHAHDVAHGVFSVPAKLGVAGALWVARASHAACAAMFVALGVTTPEFGVPYFAGVAAAVGLLVVEHALVKPNDLSKVGLAFFTMNGVISLLLGTLGIIDVLRR